MSTTKALTALLVGGGVIAGVALGWGLPKILEASANQAQVATAIAPTHIENPVSRQWMITQNGAVVFGEKFLTELECDQARRHYIEKISSQERATIEMVWRHGYRRIDYPYFQADLEKAKSNIREAEGSYCLEYSS